MNRISASLLAALTVLALLPMLGARGAVAEAAVRVATVDMAKVLRGYEAVKRAVGYIKEKKDEYQKTIDQMQEDIRKLNSDIQLEKEKGQGVDEKETQKRKMIFELQRKYQDLRDKLDRMEAEEFDQIKDRIKVEIQKLAKQKGIELVIEKQWLYHGASEDITDQLLATLGK